MTTRLPIVLNHSTGKFEELPTGDVIAAALNGTNGTNGMNGGAITIPYTFDTTTTDSDPGNGKLRLDNATQSSSTKIYPDLVDNLGSTWTSVIDTFDDSTNTNKADIRLVKVGDATKWLTFTLTAWTTASGYRKLTVTNTGSSASSPFADGDSILLCWTRAGDAGTNGTNGTNGSGFKFTTSVVTSGSQSTITFSSIANTAKDLLLVFSGRDTATGSSDLSARLMVNGDTTSGNYSAVVYTLGNASAAASGTIAASSAGVALLYCPGTSGNANAMGTCEIRIPNYAGTTFQKPMHSYGFECPGSSLFVANRGCVWKSTAAISSLTITAAGTAFVDGTTATLYGMG